MNGQGLTPRYSYFNQFKPDDIEHYLDYLRDLERQGPAGLTQDRRFVSGPEELAPQPEPEYGGLGYGAPQGIERPRLGIPEGPEIEEPIQAGLGIPEPTGLGLVRGVRRGVEQLQATGYGALGLLGSGLGIDDLTKWGFEGYLRNIEEAERYPKEVDFLDIRGPGDALTYATETFGELIPSMAEAALTGMAGAIIGSAVAPGPGTASGAIAGFFGKRAVRKMIDETAKQLIKKGVRKAVARKVATQHVEKISLKAIEKQALRKFGAKAGVVAGVAPIEAGGNWGENMEKGIDNPWTALATGTAAGLLELAGGNIRIIDKVLGKTAGAAYKRAIKNRLVGRVVSMVQEAAAQAPMEFAQESGQELLSMINVGLNDPEFEYFTKENMTRLLESGMAGAVAGVGMGAPTGLATGMRGPEAPPPSPPPYEMERKYIPPVDLIDTMPDDAKKGVKAALAEARKGTLTVDQLENIQNTLAERYPANTKEIQNIEKEIARLREMAPRPGEELEAVEPVEVEEGYEMPGLEIPERMAIPEEVAPEEELTPEEEAEIEAVETEVEAGEDYMRYLMLEPDSDEIMEIEGVEVRKLREIPVEVPLPEGVEARAYTDGENIYLKEGLSPDEFVSAIDEEMESIRTGVLPTIEEEYPELVEEGIEEIPEEVVEKPTASFLSWQETPEGDHIALYNIESGPKEGTQAMVEGLEREGIEIPKTPKKPAKVPSLEEQRAAEKAKIKPPEEKPKEIPNFTQLAKTKGTSPTGEAIDWGVKASPEQIELAKIKQKELVEESERISKEAMAIPKGPERTKKLEESPAFEAQFVREAIEASEGRHPTQVKPKPPVEEKVEEVKPIVAPQAKEGKVTNVLIKTKDGTIYESEKTHPLMINEFDRIKPIEIDGIDSLGVRVEGGRIVWRNVNLEAFKIQLRDIRRGEPEAVEEVAKPTPEVKEPWKMSILEFGKQKEGNPFWDKHYPTTGDEAYLRDVQKYHQESVQQAISEGKIKSHPDYPELGKVKPEEPWALPKVEYVKNLEKGKAKNLTEFAKTWVDEIGNWRMPGDTLSQQLTGRSEKEIIEFINWARTQSSHVERFAGSVAGAELRSRGIPVDEIKWQQENLAAYAELGKVEKPKAKEPSVAELQKGAIEEIPLSDITGLEPQPRPRPTKKVAVTEPIELVFTDQGDLILEAGNHRYHQAVFNGDKTIPAKIRFEKGSEGLWSKRAKPTPPEPKVEKEAFISKETQAKARDAETKARQKRLKFAASQKHLVPWISASGGVWDVGLKGEIDDIIYTQDARGRQKPRKGVMQGFLNRTTGRTLDIIVRDAREAGFDVKNTDHLLELIEKDLAGALIGDIKGRVGKLTTETETEEEFREGLIENGREQLRAEGYPEEEIGRIIERGRKEGWQDAEITPVNKAEETAEELGNWFKEQGEKVERPPEELEPTKKILTVNLKKEYWDAIKTGDKTVEYRLFNDFWKKRLEGKEYDEIHLKLGYPKKTDTEKTIVMPWEGYEIETIQHKEFGPDPVQVFSIKLGKEITEPTEVKPPTEIEKIQAKITALQKEAYDVAAKVAKPWTEKFKARYQLELKRHKKQIATYEEQIATFGQDIFRPPPTTGTLFPPPDETRLAIAGEKAIGAPTGALAKAQEMLARGEDEKAVWKATGWMKGAEGKWKWEIDDSGARKHGAFTVMGSENYKLYKEGEEIPLWLSELLEHDKLYKAYPELENMIIWVSPESGSAGQYVPPIAKTKYANSIVLRTDDKDTLLHEIQHAIQEIEGLARGGAPEQFVSKYRQRMWDLMESVNQYNVALKEKVGDTEAYNKLMDKKLAVVKEYQDLKELGPLEAVQKYKHLAGEIEAREVAIRKGLTPEFRRLLPPYAAEMIPREDWIIRKGTGTSFSVEPALAAEPRGYEFTKQQQKDVNLIEMVYFPQWLEKASFKDLASELRLKVKPYIDLTEFDPKQIAGALTRWEKEGVTAGKILGAATVEGMETKITLALNGRNLKQLEHTTLHELYERFRNEMVSAKDRARLDKDPFFKTIESEADGFADYMVNTKSIKDAPNFLKRTFLKLKRLLTIIRNGLNRRGFYRPEDIWGKMRVGVGYPRKRGRGGAGIAFELTPEIKLALEKRFFQAVAIRLNDGTVYKGTPGEIHLDVMDRIPTEKIGRMHQRLLYDNMGFINQEGKFYTRSEAIKAVNEWEARRMGAVGLMPETRLAMKKLTPEEREWADNWIKENVRPPEKQVAQVPKQKEEFEKLPKEQDKPDEPSSFEEAKDDWFGNKDWGRQVFTVEAKRIQDTIKETLGKKRYDKEAQDIDHAIHVYLDLKRNPEHLEEFYDDLTADQKKIVNLATKIPENPGLMHIADYLRGVYDKIGEKALSQNVIFNTIDNYVARAWKIPKKMPTDIMQKFKTTSRHSKHRVFETILEGWSKGYELEITGASNNLELLRGEIARTIEDKRLVSKLRKTEWRDTGNPVIIHKQLKGYEEIKHPNFTYWVPEAKIKHGDTTVYGPKFRVQTNWGAIKGENKRATKLFDNEEAARGWVGAQENPGEFRIEKREYLWRREPLYAPEEIAKRLNKILGVSKLKGIGPIDTITKYNAIFKSTILLTSLFHHQAFIRSYLLGTRHKTLAEWNPFKMYKEGLKAINELGPEIELLVRNGLTLGKMQDWEENILRQEDTVIGKVLDKTRYTKAFKDWANEMRERQAKFLFQNFGAGLKAQAALIEYRNMLKENPDLEPNERAKIIAELINDDFGGLHLQRMERNPTTQHIFRLLALASDWTESNVNTMWKAFRSGEAAKTHLYRRFWASVITKGLTAQVIANILLSFMDDDDYITRFKKAWAAGHFRWLDIDVTPIYKLFGGKSEARKYFGIFGHFRDPMKFIIHPIRSAKHKGSVFFRIFLEALTGIDWKGHRFTSLSELLGYDDKGLYVRETEEHKIGEPKGGKLRLKTVTPRIGKKGPIGWQQIPSYMISQLRGITPVQVQNFIGWIQGEIEGFDAIGRSIGAHVGSTYPTEKKQTEDFVDQWLDIKREGDSFAELRAKVMDYNERQELRPPDDAVPISWSTIAKKGINIRKAELAGERRKAVNE